MLRQDVLDDLKHYYDIREVVSPALYELKGDDAWFVFSTEFLTAKLELRKLIGVPAICNNWHYADPAKTKIFTQRGWRDNLTQIVKGQTYLDNVYVSGHNTCGASDQTFKGVSAEEVRLEALANHDKFTYKIRFEHMKKNKKGIYEPITWVHMDVKYYENNPKVYLFNV